MSNDANSDKNTFHMVFKTADGQIGEMDYEIEQGSPNAFSASKMTVIPYAFLISQDSQSLPHQKKLSISPLLMRMS